MRENEILVTVARFENGFDAEVAKMALDNEGIKCHLAGANLQNTIPYLHTISVELQVLEGDAECAKEVLDRRADVSDEPEDIEEQQ